MRACLCQRHIVFIQQKDHRLFVIVMKHLHDQGKTCFQHRIGCLSIHYIDKLQKNLFIKWIYFLAFCQIKILPAQFRNSSLKHTFR